MALYARLCPAAVANCATTPGAWTQPIGGNADLVITTAVGGTLKNPEIAFVRSEDAAGTVFPSIYIFHIRDDGTGAELWSSRKLCLGAPGPAPVWQHVRVDPPGANESQGLGTQENGMVAVAEGVGKIRVVWTETYLVGGVALRERIQTATTPIPGC